MRSVVYYIIIYSEFTYFLCFAFQTYFLLTAFRFRIGVIDVDARSSKRKESGTETIQRKKTEKGVKDIYSKKTDGPASREQLETELYDKDSPCFNGPGGCFRKKIITPLGTQDDSMFRVLVLHREKTRVLNKEDKG